MAEEPRKKTKPVNEKNMQAMALSVIRYLARNGLFQDVDIYAGGMHYSDSPHQGQAKDEASVKNACLYAGPYSECPCEYNNPETLTMTFEGPLYKALNYGLGRGYKCEKELNGIFARYGLYLEYGYAWSLTCYPG